VKYSIIVLLLLPVLIVRCTNMKLNESELVFPTSFQISGELAHRIELTEQRLQVNHPFTVGFVLQDVARVQGSERRFEEYEGDVSGRVLSAWSYAARLLKQRPAKLDSIANGILLYQNPNGSFGRNQQPEGWDMWGRQLWGHGRLLVGLIEYYKLSHDERVLQAAERLGDYLTATIADWAVDNRSHHWFTNYTSLIESLMILNECSENSRYLEAAQKMAALIPEFGYYHSHGFLISLVGLAKLFQKTNDPAYWHTLQDIYWRDLIRHTHRPDGAVCEWFPLDSRTEGCSIVDWLRLNLHMWQISRDAIYLEEAERTWLNALNFHQTHNGAFGHARINSRGFDSPYSEAWWCCLMHGLFGFAEVLQHSIAAEGNKVYVNFFTPMQTQIALGDSQLGICMITDYPANGNIEIKFDTESANDFTLYLRIPEWADNYQIRVNSELLQPSMTDGYLCIQRSWRNGDTLHLNLPMSLRLEDDRGNKFSYKSTVDHFTHSAYFFYGPLLLSADLRQNKTLPDVVIFEPAKDYRQESPTTENSNSPFSHPNTHFQIPAKSNHCDTTVLLVPMSEQTGYFNWGDELPNFIRTGEEPIQRVSTRLTHNIQIIH